jgi:DNA-binding MarR family transcriptional regulator
MRSALARAAGISGSDLDALEHLEADGSLTQRQLGDRLSLTSGAITMLVDRLAGSGWVRRRSHPTDRRAVLLELVSEAPNSVPAGLAAYHSRIQDLARAVPPEQAEPIRTFLAAAAEAASRAVGELDREGEPG